MLKMELLGEDRMCAEKIYACDDGAQSQMTEEV